MSKTIKFAYGAIAASALGLLALAAANYESPDYGAPTDSAKTWVETCLERSSLCGGDFYKRGDYWMLVDSVSDLQSLLSALESSGGLHIIVDAAPVDGDPVRYQQAACAYYSMGCRLPETQAAE